MKKFIFALILLSVPLLSNAGQQLTIDITVPEQDVPTYHRPYISVWLETPKRKGVTTIALWYEQDDWLKDLRQWWRKLGRKNRKAYDAVTGPTRKPGVYRINWHGLDNHNQPIPAGDYFLCIEASREAGGRDFSRQKIQWGNNNKQTLSLPSKFELGDIEIKIQ